jgi:hypothetical protein
MANPHLHTDCEMETQRLLGEILTKQEEQGKKLDIIVPITQDYQLFKQRINIYFTFAATIGGAFVWIADRSINAIIKLHKGG